MKIKDQMGRALELKIPVKSIVSLVPSQTEFLFDLGLHKEVLGITKFCIHPNSWFREKIRVGGTKNANLEMINKLQPDLVIGNKEENQFENIQEIEAKHPVWMSDIANLDEAYEMMAEIGLLTGKTEKAGEIIEKIKNGFATLTPNKENQKVLYFIWANPWMVAGKGTFIDDMLKKCGFENAIKEERYPRVDLREIKDVDRVFLSSEPYPFKQKHIEEINEFLPNTHVHLVDGEMFSWYGSRLVHAPKYFSDLLSSLE